MKKLTLVFDDVPDKAFIPVVRKRDILKARILTASDKAKLTKGSSDVHVESPLGHERLMSRNEIINKYNYLNGHKIKMAGWKTGKEYIIMCNDNTNAAAMMIPINCAMSLGGKMVNVKNKEYGEYVVCMQDSNGKIDRSTASVISRSMFRKMFSILPNNVIEKHAGSGNRAFNRKNDIKNTVKEVSKQPELSKVNTGNRIVPVNNTERRGLSDSIKGNIDKSKPVSNVSSKEAPSNSKFNAVGKLLNENNKIVGFVIKDNNGMTKQVSKKEMLALCTQKLVGNIVIATKEDSGAKYLRGNGIKIESLAPFYV